MRNGKTDLVEQARQLRIQATALEKMARTAKGTQRGMMPWTKVLVQPKHGVYFTGDEGTTEELLDVVQRMLTERPWRFSEMLEASGARDNRIKGVLMRLQREGVRVIDIAPEGSGKALWFIPSDAATARVVRARRLSSHR